MGTFFVLVSLISAFIQCFKNDQRKPLLQTHDTRHAAVLQWIQNHHQQMNHTESVTDEDDVTRTSLEHISILECPDQPPDYKYMTDTSKSLYPPPPDYESALKMGPTDV